MAAQNKVSSIFLHEQIPTDFSCLANGRKCFPSNVDGITERNGCFLIFELKHGEELSEGQFRMLKAWAKKPNCTVLVIDCLRTKPNEKNARDFIPVNYSVLQADGNPFTDYYMTDVGDFAERYAEWLEKPDTGSISFTRPATKEVNPAKYFPCRD